MESTVREVFPVTVFMDSAEDIEGEVLRIVKRVNGLGISKIVIGAFKAFERKSEIEIFVASLLNTATDLFVNFNPFLGGESDEKKAFYEYVKMLKESLEREFGDKHKVYLNLNEYGD